MSKQAPPYFADRRLAKFAVPLESLNLDAANERTHNARNIEAIKNSLRRFGWREPVGVRRDGRVVIRGNGTIAAVRLLAEAAASDDPDVRASATVYPGTEHEAEADWSKVPALIFDDDDELAAAWRVAHNRTAELAEWDIDALAGTLSEFPDFNWAEIGWSPDELGEIGIEWEAPEADPDTTIVGEHERKLAGDDSEDDIPEVPAEPVTKLGDVIELGPHVLHCADCMEVMRSLPDNSVDAIVTDPPYGLSPDGRARTWDEIEELRREGKGPKGGFMGRAWDAGVPGLTWAKECLRVLKPGGHIIAFSATRTVHRLACALEDAGFELRDQIGWLQWQGFPKSHDVSKAIDALHGAGRQVIAEHPNPAGNKPGGTSLNMSAIAMITAPATEDAKRWIGWGTALKPANEPAVLARKPLELGLTVAEHVLKWGTGALNIDACRFADGDKSWPGPHNGEWQATGHVGNWVAGGRAETEGPASRSGNPLGLWPANIYACPKPATREREDGCDELDQVDANKWNSGGIGERRRAAGLGFKRNSHPTVKPVRLMRWLLRLVTPPGGTVLEPFAGSGTTLVAAADLDCRVIATEREPGYADIIRARVEHSLAKQDD